MNWLTVSYFHVGLICSRSPEQEGPGGVGVCVTEAVYVHLKLQAR